VPPALRGCASLTRASPRPRPLPRAQAFNGAWGWADASCSLTAAYICEFAARPPPPAPPAAGAPEAPEAYTYTDQGDPYRSPTAGAQYTLYTRPLDYSRAAAACQAAGGGLVWYASLAEQQQVELALQGAGALAPAAGALGFYWMGLRVAGSWPNFRWQVPAGLGLAVLQPGTLGAYVHWGSVVPPPGREPNQGQGPELCAGANSTEVRGAGPCCLTACVCAAARRRACASRAGA
jgi:hypothetical protein